MLCDFRHCIISLINTIWSDNSIGWELYLIVIHTILFFNLKHCLKKNLYSLVIFQISPFNFYIKNKQGTFIKRILKCFTRSLSLRTKNTFSQWTALVINMSVQLESGNESNSTKWPQPQQLVFNLRINDKLQQVQV